MSGPFIGLRTIDLADSQYVRVIEVVKHAASHKNGILLNDTLTHFNGKVIESMKYFMGEVAKLNPGDTITLTVLRQGISTDYRYPLGALKSTKVTEIVCCDPEPEMNNIAFVLSPDILQHTLRIFADETIKIDVAIEVLDLNGSVLQSEKIKKSKSKFDTKIDISQLATGIYYIKILVDKNQYVHRFVKDK